MSSLRDVLVSIGDHYFGFVELGPGLTLDLDVGPLDVHVPPCLSATVVLVVAVVSVAGRRRSGHSR